MIKNIILILGIALLIACTDTDRAKYGSYWSGHPAHIKCYSSGELIYDGVSTGRVKFEGLTKRHITFRDATDRKLRQISGNCVIAYFEGPPLALIKQSTVKNPFVDTIGPCLIQKFTAESLAVKAKALPASLEEINKIPLCVDYCANLKNNLDDDPHTIWLETKDILDICAMFGVILPKDRFLFGSDLSFE